MLWAMMLKISNMPFLYFPKTSSNTIFSLSVLSKVFPCQFNLQILCHYTFQPLWSYGNKFQIWTVPNLFFHFFQWGGACTQFTGWNAKTMFQLAEHVSKIILAPDKGPVTTSLELTVRKFSFFWSLKNSPIRGWGGLSKMSKKIKNVHNLNFLN